MATSLIQPDATTPEPVSQRGAAQPVNSNKQVVGSCQTAGGRVVVEFTLPRRAIWRSDFAGYKIRLWERRHFSAENLWVLPQSKSRILGFA